jgi:molybdate transport system substrate-binding protein
MMRGFLRARFVSMTAAASVLAALAGPAAANELTVYGGGAVKEGVTEAAAIYAKQKGVKFALEFYPMGPLTKKLAEGGTPDIVIVTQEVLDDIAKKGVVGRDPVTEVGRVGLGVAVREGAPAPDISTPEALKKTLLAAKSIVYIDPTVGTSGRHFASVLERLEIVEAMKSKTSLGKAGYVVEPVGRGEIEVGVHMITEILPVKGVKLVGPLPAALQKETVYVGALTAAARNRTEALGFLAFLRTPEIRSIFAGKGFMEKR